MSGKQLLVKFVPWNENTFLSLKNKEMKFSTAYDLNDYNEFNYSAHWIRYHPILFNKKKKTIKEITEILFSDPVKREELFQNLTKTRYTNEAIQNFKAQLQDFEDFIENFDKKSTKIKEDLECLKILLESIAFSSVGIFSCSNVDILNSNWQQLSYAYYADSLKGLVLLYEQKNSTKHGNSVKYKKILSSSDNVKVLEWANEHDPNRFSEMRDFSQKLHIWKHEKELRMFDSPGIKKASDFGMELKAVFYTGRIQDDLCKVHNALSGSPTKIQEIHPGYGLSKAHLFKVVKENKNIFEWVQKKFLS